MTFGEMIKTIAEEKGISAAELARQIGKTRSYVCSLEKGREKAPIKETVYKIAEALGEDPTELWEQAATERFEIWAAKEGIESAKALVFFQHAVVTTKAMAKRISKLIKTNKVQKAAALALVIQTSSLTKLLCYILSDTKEEKTKFGRKQHFCTI